MTIHHEASDFLLARPALFAKMHSCELPLHQVTEETP